MKFFLTIPIFIIFMCISVNADNFNIKTTKDKFEIKFSGGKVYSLPGKFIFYFTTRYGIIGFTPRSTAKVVSVKVIKDDDVAKRIELISAPFDYKKLKNQEFYLTVEVRKDSPLLFVESAWKNNSEESGDCYFFWRISPLYSDIYVTGDGDCNYDSGKLKFNEWLFLPHENKSGGSALIIDSSQKNLQLKSYYPKKNWRKIGLYLLKNLPGADAKPIGKGESNSINFVFLPASDEEDAEQYWEKVKEKKLFPALNK